LAPGRDGLLELDAGERRLFAQQFGGDLGVEQRQFAVRWQPDGAAQDRGCP